MNNRTAVILLSLAFVLLGFIYFVERDSLSTAEKKSRLEHVFPTFQIDAVSEFSIARDGGHPLVVRRVSQLSQGEERWEIVSPRKLKADAVAVREVLSAIDFLLRERVVEDDATGARYGLTAPRVEASFLIGKNRTTFRIGAEDTRKHSVYVQVEGAKNSFFAVQREFFETLDKGESELRDRHLIEGSLSLATAISLGNMHLQKVAGSEMWLLKGKNGAVQADRAGVMELLDHIGNLSAKRFVDGKTVTHHEYPFSVDIEMPTNAKQVVFIGGDCGEDTVYAKLESPDSIMCVSSEILDVLKRPEARYIEMRPLPYAAQDITGYRIDRDGKSLEIEKSPEDLWTVKNSLPEKTDQVAVVALIERFSKSKALAAIVGTAELETLGTPVASAVFALDTGRASVTLRFYRPKNDSGTVAETVLVRRDEEALLLTVPQTVLDSLHPDVLLFRKRELRQMDQASVVQMEITGTGKSVLARSDSGWSLESPIAGVADDTHAQKLLQLLCDPPIVRFLRTGEYTACEFHAPVATLAAETALTGKEAATQPRKESRTVLEVGAQTSDGDRCARFAADPHSAFVITETDAASLFSVALSRRLAAVDVTRVSRVVFRRGEREWAVSLEGNEWKSTTRSIGGVTLKRLLLDLGALKALRVQAIGKPVDKPSLIFELYREDGTLEKRLAFASTAGEMIDEQAAALMRDDEMNVTWAIPARLMNELLGLLSEEKQ